MLKELVEMNRCLFLDRIENWQAALRISCEPLIKDGIVEETYGEELIQNVNKYGPYIVLAPGLAIPHAMEGAKGVKGTGISFMKVKEPVRFDPEDPEKYAVVFFTLAATDSKTHLKNMRRLCQILSNEKLLGELMEVTSPEGLIRLQEKYSAELGEVDNVALD